MDNTTNIFVDMPAKDIAEQILHLPATTFGDHDPVDFLFCLKTVQKALGPIPSVIGSDVWCLTDKILTASESSCRCYLLQDRIESVVTLLSNGTRVGRLENLSWLDPEMMMEFLLGLDEDNLTWMLDYVASVNCEFYAENFNTEADYCSMLDVNGKLSTFATEKYQNSSNVCLLVRALKAEVGNYLAETELYVLADKIAAALEGTTYSDPVRLHVNAVAEIMTHGFLGGNNVERKVPAEGKKAAVLLLSAPQDVFNTIMDEQIEYMECPTSDAYALTNEYQKEIDAVKAFIDSFING